MVTRSFQLDLGYSDNGTDCRNKCSWYDDESYYSCWTVAGEWGNCTPVVSGRHFDIAKSLDFIICPNISSLLDPCEDWPSNYFEKFDEPNGTLVDELYEYGRHNLALIHVMIQSPYVTIIKRDIEMTLLSFIADTGGLLGLCLGFSFISMIEIFFWICSCCRDFKKI